MKDLKLFLAAILACFLVETAVGQDQIYQTIRGTIVDQEAQAPLIGVNILVKNTDPFLGAVSDLDGQFRISKVPIGRHDLEITYLGYEPLMLNSIMLEAGKELVLNLEMLEATEDLEEVVVTASSQLDKTKPLNEMATVSARTFSVEETGRYASSGFDPSRMAQNYAGVSVGAGDDLNNEIVIRGNSPAGVLWRLEGVESPNPNHFSTIGNSGGAISMLSSSTLTNSDFYTGAFPSEFGNALSGVFDLSMRKGNNEKREYSFMLGALGIEVAAEGPFSPNSKASYLINYRYSTLAALEAVGLNPTGDILPKYQDVSFKVNIPTKKMGVFSLFGLGGNNLATSQPKSDSLEWALQSDNWGFESKQNVGTIGLSHRLLLTDRSYLKTVLMASYEDNEDNNFWLDRENNYKEILDKSSNAINKTYRLSSTYSNKLNAKNTIRAGAIISYKDYQFEWQQRQEGANELALLFDNSGATFLIQAFGQWKHRLNKSVTLNTGVHFSQMTFNNKRSVEPRGAIQWKVNPGNTLSFASGLHSKMEHLGFYLFDGTLADGRVVTPKDHLGFTKSFHNVLAYDLVLNPSLRLKMEMYYQHLYEVPVENNPESTTSILNAFNNWDAIALGDAVAEGQGRNMGIDLTLEKFFTQQYYFMLTGSLYDSRFSTLGNEFYSTRFNGNYQLNTLGGKEFKVGKSGKNIVGINGKFTLSGGNRYTPIDEHASQLAGEAVYFEDLAFASRSGVYYRFDVGFSYKINTKKMTHSFMFDIQNATNRKNIGRRFYDPTSNQIESRFQTGFFPTFNYRIEW